MKKVPLSPVNSVLNKVLANLGLDRRLREHTFISLWPTFVNSAIADRSRPLFIDNERNLVISVADAATGQELSMMKGRVTPKLAAAARSLGIDIRGLRMDLKHYHASSTMPTITEEKPLPKPTEEALTKTILNADDLQQLAQLQAQLSADTTVEPVTADKVISLFERELRIRRWRFDNKFPLCPGCGNPVERLHAPEASPFPTRAREPVCVACLYADT